MGWADGERAGGTRQSARRLPAWCTAFRSDFFSFPRSALPLSGSQALRVSSPALLGKSECYLSALQGTSTTQDGKFRSQEGQQAHGSDHGLIMVWSGMQSRLIAWGGLPCCRKC